MQTILLADDERVFRALEGTCLRRERCRLVKAASASLVAVSVAEPPDLIVLALDGEETRRALRELCASEALSSVPIIALDFGGSPAPRARGAGRRRGSIDLLGVSRSASGRFDLADLDARLDLSIKRHLPILDRAVDRVTVSLAVRCQGEGEAFTVRTKNISPSGLFLKTDRDLLPGDRIRVRFVLPAEAVGAAGAIAATCQVVRRVGPGQGDDDADLIRGVGVRFIDLEKPGRTTLGRYIRMVSSPAGAAGSSTRRAHTAH